MTQADEASQVITPNLAGVLRLANKWILVGDHMQLPPIIKGETQDVLQKTLFEKIAKYPDLDESILVKLDIQHRMPTELADFISSTFYDGNLKTEPGKSVNFINYNHQILQDERCISLVNVKQSEEISYKNSIEEANWVDKTVKDLIDSGWLMRDEREKPTIGVIAPYRAQVALLRRRLEEGFNGCETFEPGFWNQVVDTVDRFQGDEREIIIISLCIRPNETRIPRIYEDKRRINVSLSRAKKKLWVVGYLPGMDLIPGFKEFKAYAEANPQFCSIESDETYNYNSGNELF